jgi:hypothetical protein
MKSSIVLAALIVVGSSSVTFAVLTPEPVVTGPIDQWGPGARGDDWIGWSQYVKPDVTAHIRMQDGSDHRAIRRRAGTHTYFGAFDPSAERVLFQEARFNSNVFFYRIDTEGFTTPPAGINTDLWEWGPDMSDSFILFGRNRFTNPDAPWKVILYDRMTETFRVLDSAPNRCQCIWPETVNDRYATWTKCRARCNVFVFDTQTLARTKMPNPDRQQYGIATTGDGQVYFVRSGTACGANVRIMRQPVDLLVPPVAIYAFPAGTDLRDRLSMVEGVDGNDDLYFDRFSCSDRRFRGNIYRLRDVNLAPILSPLGAASTDGARMGRRRSGALPPGAIPAG